MKNCMSTAVANPRWRKARASLLLLGLVPAGLSTLGASCQVKKPLSDTTPPSIEWHVQNRITGATQVLQGNGTLSGPPGQPMRVTCKAIDPQGIHRISLGGGGAYGCMSGGAGTNMALSQASDVQDLNPDADNNVLTQITLMRELDTGGWTCQSGYTFTSGSITFSCTGENYFGGTTTGNLSVSRP